MLDTKSNSPTSQEFISDAVNKFGNVTKQNADLSGYNFFNLN